MITIWRKHLHKVVLHLPDSWLNWNLEMLVSEERGKPEYPKKNLSEQRREQQQTQPTYGVDPEIWTPATMVGGECSHHRAIPCSPDYNILGISFIEVLLVKLILPIPYTDTSTLRLCLLLPYHTPARGVTDVAACWGSELHVASGHDKAWMTHRPYIKKNS